MYHKYKKYGYNPIEDKEHFIYDKNVDTILSDKEKSIVDIVTKTFGIYSGRILEDITHKEEPWKMARHGLKTIDYSNEVISIASPFFDFFLTNVFKY